MGLAHGQGNKRQIAHHWYNAIDVAVMPTTSAKKSTVRTAASFLVWRRLAILKEGEKSNMVKQKALVHYAKSSYRGSFTACGKRAWWTRTRHTRDVYAVTCPKCKAVLARLTRAAAKRGGG